MGDTTSNRAFVLYGVGQSYIDSCETLALKLIEYTNQKVLVFYANGTSTVTHPNLHTVELDSTLDIFTPSDNEVYQLNKFQSVKPYICLEALKYYNELIYIDSDIQVTPHIKNAFNLLPEVEYYPIVNRYQWHYMLYGGKPWVGEYILSHLNNPYQGIPNVCTNFLVFNKKCEYFLHKWYSLCQKLLPVFADQFDTYKGRPHEEAIANALLWHFEASKYSECNFSWIVDSEGAKETFKYYNHPFEVDPHPGYPSHFLLQNSHGGGFGNSPFDENNLWGFHCVKDPNEVDIIYTSIEKHYNYE